MSPANQVFSSRSPGKLILTGEHAVVHGSPALALAVNRHVSSYCTILQDQPAGLSWQLPDLGCGDFISWTDLRVLTEQLDQRFAEFDAGKLSAAEILQSPQQLVLYCVAQLLPADDPACQLQLSVSSQLPAGAGMGSSAAASAGVLTLMAEVFAKPLNQQQLYTLSRYCERLCHGRGGMIDAATVTTGGLVEVADGEVTTLPEASLPGEWFYINSGKPEAGTGECVEQVRQHFSGSDIWSEFAGLAAEFKAVLSGAADRSVTELIRHNQQLLETIGVVPELVSEFTRAVAAAGGAAKISGAGSVRGTGGGAMIACGISEKDLAVLCQNYGYKFFAIEEDRYGARLSD